MIDHMETNCLILSALFLFFFFGLILKEDKTQNKKHYDSSLDHVIFLDDDFQVYFQIAALH